MSPETIELLTQLARARASAAPAHLRTAARLRILACWKRILACCAALASATSLVYDKETPRTAGFGVSSPWLTEVLADARRDIERATRS